MKIATPSAPKVAPWFARVLAAASCFGLAIFFFSLGPTTYEQAYGIHKGGDAIYNGLGALFLVLSICIAIVTVVKAIRESGIDW